MTDMSSLCFRAFAIRELFAVSGGTMVSQNHVKSISIKRFVKIRRGK